MYPATWEHPSLACTETGSPSKRFAGGGDHLRSRSRPSLVHAHVDTLVDLIFPNVKTECHHTRQFLFLVAVLARFSTHAFPSASLFALFGRRGTFTFTGSIPRQSNAQGGPTVPAEERPLARGETTAQSLHPVQGGVLGSASPRLLRLHPRVARQRREVNAGEMTCFHPI